MIWRSPPSGIVSTGPALFLDRDGVVIVDRDYLSDPEGVELVPGAAAAMVRAAAAGYLLIGLSNQSGIGRGRFGPAELEAVMERVDLELSRHGAALDAMYYCPHAPEAGCRCRKPGPGLLEEAAASFRWDASRSWVIGDKASDVELGRRHGLGAVLVGTGHGADEGARVAMDWSGDPLVVRAADLAGAVGLILGAGADSGGSAA
jgi:D-glycero-D-manno-heptose 1,7-bisphosphate phosphatase